MFALLRESLQMNTRRDVLKLYKSLLKLSKEWVAKEASKTEAERQAIKEEVTTRFRANKSIEDEAKVRELIKYGSDRMEIAKHYKIPFERPIHLPKGTKIAKKKKPPVVNADG